MTDRERRADEPVTECDRANQVHLECRYKNRYGYGEWTCFIEAEAAAHAIEREAAAGALPSVEALAEVLKAEGFVRGVASRYGTFNDPYWEKSAEAILARLASSKEDRPEPFDAWRGTADEMRHDR